MIIEIGKCYHCTNDAVGEGLVRAVQRDYPFEGVIQVAEPDSGKVLGSISPECLHYRYQLTFGIDVEVYARNKGQAVDRARDQIMNNHDEYGILSEYADGLDPICTHELDEHGDPIL